MSWNIPDKIVGMLRHVEFAIEPHGLGDREAKNLQRWADSGVITARASRTSLLARAVRVSEGLPVVRVLYGTEARYVMPGAAADDEHSLSIEIYTGNDPSEVGLVVDLVKQQHAALQMRKPAPPDVGDRPTRESRPHSHHEWMARRLQQGIASLAVPNEYVYLMLPYMERKAFIKWAKETLKLPPRAEHAQRLDQMFYINMHRDEAVRLF